MARNIYESVLSGRYPSLEMKQVWSDDEKFRTWRRLWTELARAQQQLGLPISDQQIEEMEAQIPNIDYGMAAELEKQLRHDVVAHAKTFGHVAPTAAPIIHNGATSCDITDNTDLILIRKSLCLLCVKVAGVISHLCSFAMEHRDLPTLGLTHLQPAQPTTVGKRATLWAQDFLWDLHALEAQRDTLMFRGLKGATGTQDSYLKLLDGDHNKVKKLDALFTSACGFSESLFICGQTYSRKKDSEVISVLANFGASAEKMCGDIRLLQSRKEIEEPFGANQIGSSAMAYKRNPMQCERVCALGRALMGQVPLALQTHAHQWMERTLDDSAARRLFLPDSFLLADAIALLLQNISRGLVVYPKVIERNLMAELPFMVTEEVILAMVEAGASRQECHERIRKHAQAAGDRVKRDGLDNNLLEVLAVDPYFGPVHGQLTAMVDPARHIGRAPEQTKEFVEVCRQAVEPYKGQLGEKVELVV